MARIKYVVYFCLLYYPIFSQNIVIINQKEQKGRLISDKSISEFNDRICKRLNSTVCKQRNDSIYIINVYNYNTIRKINKDDILDNSLFNKPLLFPDMETYKVKEKGKILKYINANAIILDKNKKLIATSDPGSVYCVQKYSKSYFDMEMFLIEKKKEYNIEQYFTIADNTSTYSTYGISYNNKIFVFYKDKKTNEMNVIPVNEFVDKFWID